MIKQRVYKWNGKTTPNIDMRSDRLVWWNEDYICIKVKEKQENSQRENELRNEIKEVEKHCPNEVTDGGRWNRLDILKAELKGITEERQRIEEEIDNFQKELWEIIPLSHGFYDGSREDKILKLIEKLKKSQLQNEENLKQSKIFSDVISEIPEDIKKKTSEGLKEFRNKEQE